MKQAINIRLEKDIIQTLDEYANELDKTRTKLIEKAIEYYFDRLDEMVADKRIDNLKSGKTKVIPLKDVFSKAGINISSLFNLLPIMILYTIYMKFGIIRIDERELFKSVIVEFITNKNLTLYQT